jgi:hypothetical protein
MKDAQTIRPRERDAVLQSLRAGVVPRQGQHLIQVGRAAEVKALLAEIERIADGGSGFRLVIGEYGAGKTFFLYLVRSIALEKKLVTMHADLGPDRRLHASGGQARSLFTELTRNLATRAKPDGGALPSIIERFVTSALQDAGTRGLSVAKVIQERMVSLSELVAGYDFAAVVHAYWKGHEDGNETLKGDAVRWLRGEFTTKTDARAALGVRTIIDDANVYDALKLLARFVRLAGYGGLLVCLDELVNLYKLPSTQARSANYEQILRMLNDCFQGAAVGLGLVLGGTPEFLLDPRKGLYSYEALKSRLAENSFAAPGLVDFTGPTIRLTSLTPEDLYVLLSRIRHVYAGGDKSRYLVSDEGIQAFMNHCSQRIGDAYFRTPRSTVKHYVDLLAVLEQNPHTTWQEQLGHVEIQQERNPDLVPPEEEGAPGDDPTRGAGATPKAGGDDDQLAKFRLG